RLFEDHYEHGLITREQFAEQNRRYLEERTQLLERRDQLQHGKSAAGVSKEDMRLAIEAADALAATWSGMTTTEKRMALRAVIREIVWTPEQAEVIWQFGERTPLPYDAVRRGTGYFDDSWKHTCPVCGYKSLTAAGLASHRRACTVAP